MRRTAFKAKPYQWKPSAPMRRTPIRRVQRPEAAAVFDLITRNGDRYTWPMRWQSEADWQKQVVDWAFLGDHDTQWWHANQTKHSGRGWFDLAIFQPNRRVGLLTELKARDRDGSAKNPTTDQWRFIAAAALCGYDVRSWLYPDDSREAYELLTGLSWSDTI